MTHPASLQSGQRQRRSVVRAASSALVRATAPSSALRRYRISAAVKSAVAPRSAETAPRCRVPRSVAVVRMASDVHVEVVESELELLQPVVRGAAVIVRRVRGLGDLQEGVEVAECGVRCPATVPFAPGQRRPCPLIDRECGLAVRAAWWASRAAAPIRTAMHTYAVLRPNLIAFWNPTDREVAEIVVDVGRSRSQPIGVVEPQRVVAVLERAGKIVVTRRVSQRVT